jgi:hypothetical protein
MSSAIENSLNNMGMGSYFLISVAAVASAAAVAILTPYRADAEAMPRAEAVFGCDAAGKTTVTRPAPTIAPTGCFATANPL